MAKKKTPKFDTSDVENVVEMEPETEPQFLVVTTNGVKRKRRCDILFTEKPTLVRIDTMNPDDVERILSEPALRCEMVSAIEAEVMEADMAEAGDYGNDVVLWRVQNARLRAEVADLRQQVANLQASLALAKAAEERAASAPPDARMGGF